MYEGKELIHCLRLWCCLCRHTNPGHLEWLHEALSIPSNRHICKKMERMKKNVCVNFLLSIECTILWNETFSFQLSLCHEPFKIQTVSMRIAKKWNHHICINLFISVVPFILLTPPPFYYFMPKNRNPLWMSLSFLKAYTCDKCRMFFSLSSLKTIRICSSNVHSVYISMLFFSLECELKAWGRT